MIRDDLALCWIISCLLRYIDSLLLKCGLLSLSADVIIQSDVLATLDFIYTIVAHVVVDGILLLGTNVIVIIWLFLLNHYFTFIHNVNCLWHHQIRPCLLLYRNLPIRLPTWSW